ncbi:hypothetical protein JW756_06395 [Candidatus Woesearchaeota archaeon]|nr:hypothetical protein [Candidatus Woesearchaeota archaeon]
MIDPANKEVRREMIREIKDLGRSTRDFLFMGDESLSAGLKDFAISSLKHLAYPTIDKYFDDLDKKYLRKYRDFERYKNKHGETLLSPWEITYCDDKTPATRDVGRFIGGFVRFIGTGILAYYSTKHPELLLLPAATNSISGVCEGFRHWENKVRSRLNKK